MKKGSEWSLKNVDSYNGIRAEPQESIWIFLSISEVNGLPQRGQLQVRHRIFR